MGRELSVKSNLFGHCLADGPSTAAFNNRVINQVPSEEFVVCVPLLFLKIKFN